MPENAVCEDHLARSSVYYLSAKIVQKRAWEIGAETMSGPSCSRVVLHAAFVDVSLKKSEALGFRRRRSGLTLEMCE
jgi:hypothetical protein